MLTDHVPAPTYSAPHPTLLLLTGTLTTQTGTAEMRR